MNDPYNVLGVAPSATDAEVKKAYRDLARKYHPDNYQDNPLADLAQEKMKEINEAYDTITRQRAGGGGSTSGRTGYQANASYSQGTSQYQNIRSAINAGQYAVAEQLLNGATNRNAEWNFLVGSLYYKRGWFDEALRYFQNAVSMDPTNMEYSQALQMASQTGYPYRSNTYGRPATVGGPDMCDMCTAMMCVNLLCRCR